MLAITLRVDYKPIAPKYRLYVIDETRQMEETKKLRPSSQTFSVSWSRALIYTYEKTQIRIRAF
jgi:hypothetical protein